MITLDYYHEKFPIVRDMIWALYDYCTSGGCCHVVTDDDNIYDDDLDFVIEYSSREENKNSMESELCIAICTAMKQMTFLQRAILFDSMAFDDYHITYSDKKGFDDIFRIIYKTDEDIIKIRNDYDWRKLYHSVEED